MNSFEHDEMIRAEAIDELKKESKIEIAKKLIELRLLPNSEIAEATGLSISDIECINTPQPEMRVKNNTNIIFLDIDGVLNTGRNQDIQEKADGKSSYYHQFQFDDRCMGNLKEIIFKFSAYVVISSSWRIEKDTIYWSSILRNFKRYNIEDRIIGKTPSFSTIRGKEIEKWLKLNEDIVSNYVIIDDEDDMLDLQNHLVLCDDYYGFDEDKKNVAINILENR